MVCNSKTTGFPFQPLDKDSSVGINPFSQENNNVKYMERTDSGVRILVSRGHVINNKQVGAVGFCWFLLTISKLTHQFP